MADTEEKIEEAKPIKSFEVDAIIFFADEKKIRKARIIAIHSTEDADGKKVLYELKGVGGPYHDGSRFYDTEQKARQFYKDEALKEIADYEVVDISQI